MNNSRWLQDMTTAEIRAYLQANDIVLIPVGATEQHGNHMAMFMDTGWAIGISQEVAERTKTVVAPPMHYGWGPHHMAYPGTMTLRADTLMQVCVDIGQSLIYHGFKKVIFVNGNRVANLPPMQLAAAHLRGTTGAYVAVADAGLIAKKAVREICTSAPGSLGHAGESETSYMLHLWPELVDMSQARTPSPRAAARFSTSAASSEPPYDGESVYVPPVAADLFALTHQDGGIVGDAAAATAEKGRRIHEAICGTFADYIETVVRPRKVTLRQIEIPI